MGANEAINKLLAAKLIKEVPRSELWCVNPLTVAANARGKRRLCIDLSRCVNCVVKSPKFKIESTVAALQVVEPGDFMFSFDLKSAYLQVRINPNFTKYFGFAAEMGDGRKRFFFYCHMCFGLNDACRVLTKLLRSPLERWRKNGIRLFIHVDDGLCLVRGRDQALKASERV